jgi:DUF4097 and DUF4098 domain-containing protein YvlB
MTEHKGYTRTVSTAEFAGTPRLVLEQPTGDVRVEGWDRPEIEVSITDERELFEIDESGSQVTVRGVPPRPRPHEFNFERPDIDLSGFGDLGIGLERIAAKVERSVDKSLRKVGRGLKGINFDFGRWSGGRDYTIRVPHDCDVSLRTSTGDLEIHGVNGTHFIQSSSGDVNMHNIKGNVLTSSASGDINVHHIEGKLGIRTASGDINVDKGTLNDLSAHTASGDINLDLLSAPDRDFEIKGISGDVDLTLPANSRLTIEVSTLSGDIDSRFQHEMERRGPGRGRSTTLRINGGGPTARISTVSGDINIHPRKGERVVSDVGEPTRDLSRRSEDDIREPEGYAARKQHELEILQALERGELSAQDAMQRLTSLERE